MKIHSFLFSLFIVLSSFFVAVSCKKNKNCTDSNISHAGSDESHNFGKNCMQCHKSGGEGEGCFSVAGSVVQTGQSTPLSSGTIKFFTAPNGGGTLKYTIAIDAKGNFHTTESTNISGLYPAVTGPSGTTSYMSSTPSTGACNSCHGSSTSRISGN